MARLVLIAFFALLPSAMAAQQGQKPPARDITQHLQLHFHFFFDHSWNQSHPMLNRWTTGLIIRAAGAGQGKALRLPGVAQGKGMPGCGVMPAMRRISW